MIVYTVGYWGRSISEMLSLLKENGITMVVDVRRFPKSSDPNFCRENLERILGENGIKYIFMGESLGGFVKGGYERYMETQRFKEGLNRLIELTRDEVIAIMCKERSIKYCHRRFIAQQLERLGIKVKNL